MCWEVNNCQIRSGDCFCVSKLVHSNIKFNPCLTKTSFPFYSFLLFSSPAILNPLTIPRKQESRLTQEQALLKRDKEEKPTPAWEWALLKGHLRIELILGVITIVIRIEGSYGKGIEPICKTILPFQYSPFLLSTLINNFLTVSISSALLDATNRVKLANASLLMIDWFV